MRSKFRAAIGNAFVFAVGWTIGAFIIWLTLRQLHVVPHLTILSGIGMAIRFGFVGFITGAVFPSIMRVAYRGKRLSEISWWKFGIAGGFVAGLFVPTFMQTMNILTGGPMVPFSLIKMDIISTAFLGAVASGLSLRLAQYAETLFPVTFQDHLERLEQQTQLLERGTNVSAHNSRRIEISEVPRRDA